jgi:hypothetical protein
MCVCVYAFCVCVREREKEKEGGREREEERYRVRGEQRAVHPANHVHLHKVGSVLDNPGHFGNNLLHGIIYRKNWNNLLHKLAQRPYELSKDHPTIGLLKETIGVTV